MPSWVYFMQDVETGLIKIGESRNPPGRKTQIEQSAQCRLEILATIPQPVPIERLLHFRFEYCRVHGEWFRPDPELLALIDDYRCRFDLMYKYGRGEENLRAALEASSGLAEQSLTLYDKNRHLTHINRTLIILGILQIIALVSLALSPL